MPGAYPLSGGLDILALNVVWKIIDFNKNSCLIIYKCINIASVIPEHVLYSILRNNRYIPAGAAAECRNLKYQNIYTVSGYCFLS